MPQGGLTSPSQTVLQRAATMVSAQHTSFALLAPSALVWTQISPRLWVRALLASYRDVLGIVAQAGSVKALVAQTGQQGQ